MLDVQAAFCYIPRPDKEKLTESK